ncbi:MAG: DUF4136 domain-containing protein [bacterium]
MRIRGLRICAIRAAVGLIAAALGSVMLASCTPEGAFQNAEDYDVVVTLYDKETDYGSIRTYLMPDSVVHFQDPQNPGQSLTHDYDDLILERVEYNLQAIGYRRESDPENEDPDIIVMVSATSSDWQAYSYPWLPRWGWWGQWPGGTTDWYYQSPYYGSGGVYTFSTGTLLIDMGDIREADEEEEMKGIWTAAMNGVLMEEASGAPQRLVDFIDRAFSQSPYLGAD